MDSSPVFQPQPNQQPNQIPQKIPVNCFKTSLSAPKNSSSGQFLPIIDISHINNSQKRQECIQKIHNACIDWGFFYIKGHGISSDLISKLEKVSRDFFRLNETEKMKISMQKGGSAWRGYFPVGSELTSGKPDLKEGIYFGQDEEKSLQPLVGPNLYASETMKTIISEYIKQTTKLGFSLVKAIGAGLGLEKEFTQYYSPNPTILFRIFNYPPVEQSQSRFKSLYPDSIPPSDIWGVREHTDYGILTILLQDNSGGLQVLSKKGEWIEAPPIPDTFIVNIGDMLQLWTNEKFPATLHRVRNNAHADRMSWPFFFDPKWDAPLKPLIESKKSTKKQANRWDGVALDSYPTYGEYLLSKVEKVFPVLKSHIAKRQ